MPCCFREQHPSRNLQTNAVWVDHRYTTVFTTRPAYDLQLLLEKRVEPVVNPGRGTYGGSVQRMMKLDVDLIDFYDEQIKKLDLYLEQNAKIDDPDTFFRLMSIPGVGRILAMTLLYEIHDIRRFPKVGDFLSYARLVKGTNSSAGKQYKPTGAKIGNPHLKWGFSEAITLLKARVPGGQGLRRANRTETQQGTRQHVAGNQARSCGLLDVDSQDSFRPQSIPPLRTNNLRRVGVSHSHNWTTVTSSESWPDAVYFDCRRNLDTSQRGWRAA